MCDNNSVNNCIDLLTDLTTALNTISTTTLIDIKGVAAMLDIGESTANRLDTSGKLPLPIRIGKSKKWRINEVRQWLQEGAPSRTKWETLKQQFGFK